MASVEAPANLARQFNHAASQLHGHSSELLSSMPKGMQVTDVRMIHELLGSTVGSVMLQAFSIELMLKALRNKHKVTPKKSHNLLTLFSELPLCEKAAAEQAYANKIAKYNILHGCSFSDNLEKLLRQYAEAFEEWRYTFEYKPKKAAIGEMQMAFEVFDERSNTTESCAQSDTAAT